MRLMLVLLLSVCLVGCAGPASTSVSVSSWNSLTPTVWPPQGVVRRPNGGSVVVPLPVIGLYAAGRAITGQPSEYGISGSQGEMRHTDDITQLWIAAPLTPLTVTVGQPISFTTDQGQAPEVWFWVVLDDQGNLLDAAVLPGQQSTYALTQPGDYLVRLLAQWDTKNYVSYLFRVVVE